MVIEAIDLLCLAWDNSNKLYTTFKINTVEYEEVFYQATENLINIKYGDIKTELIMWYIFGRIDLEGNLTPLLLIDKETSEEKELYLKTSLELWNFLEKIDPPNDEKKDEKSKEN